KCVAPRWGTCPTEELYLPPITAVHGDLFALVEVERSTNEHIVFLLPRAHIRFIKAHLVFRVGTSVLPFDDVDDDLILAGKGIRVLVVERPHFADVQFIFDSILNLLGIFLDPFRVMIPDREGLGSKGGAVPSLVRVPRIGLLKLRK